MAGYDLGLLQIVDTKTTEPRTVFMTDVVKDTLPGGRCGQGVEKINSLISIVRCF